jgi:hypothetical protein
MYDPMDDVQNIARTACALRFSVGMTGSFL